MAERCASRSSSSRTSSAFWRRWNVSSKTRSSVSDAKPRRSAISPHQHLQVSPSLEDLGGLLQYTVSAAEDQALEAVADAAEIWGGDWVRQGRGGRLELPVTAGLRQGFLAGEVEARGTRDRTELGFRIDSTSYSLHMGSVAVLLFGGVGALLTIVAPLFPELLWQLVPFGVIFMVVAWLLVASKVRHRSAEDFFDLVRELVDHEMADEERRIPGAEPVE